MIEWRSVVGHPGYEVSNTGLVRSIDRVVLCADGTERHRRGRVLAPCRSRKRSPYYLTVSLCLGGVKVTRPVHQLVLEAFVGPRPDVSYDGCHGDGDSTNNHVDNLRWGTKSENNLDTLRHGNNRYASTAHCKWGHAMSGANLAEYAKRDGHRQCLACQRASNKVRRMGTNRAENPDLFRKIADAEFAALTHVELERAS